MKIALLTDGLFPYTIGGMQKHSFYLARHLARLGIEVALFYAEETPADADVRSLLSEEEQRQITTTCVQRPAGDRLPGHYIRQSRGIARALWAAASERDDLDFVLAQGFAGWEAIRARRAGVPGIPPVGVHFHGLEMWQRPASLRAWLEHRLLRPFVRWHLYNADAAFLLGRAMAPILDRTGAPPPSCLLSPNGVTADWMEDTIPPTPATRRFLFVGRYERRKGIEELHDVVARLAGRPGFHIDFVGPIPERLRRPSAAATYWGAIRDETQMRALLRNADVLVCPSYSEGMPTVILEAMASGLAVIATDVGAVREMVSEANGWVIPPGDRDALHAAMADALERTPDAIDRMKAESRRRVEASFLWDRVAATTLEEIRGFLERTAHPSTLYADAGS